MIQEVINFARFYAALNRLPVEGGREELKRQLVLQYTDGRTDSLHGMTRREYVACCEALERENGYRGELRKRRSECLRLMQRLGVDTTDWTRVNAFCEDRRIAGKVFGRLTAGELQRLGVKLRTVLARGGLKRRTASVDTKPGAHLVLDLGKGGEA